MNTTAPTSTPDRGWLKRYYALRALVSAIWVALALTVGKAQPAFGTVLLIAYPAWDCLANYIDAKRSGGLRSNPTQFANVAVSAVVTLAVVLASTRGIAAAIAVIGVWASLSGLLQLSTAVRRWNSASAQWPMILSGAQSTLAGLFFVKQAFDAPTGLGVANVAGYAAVGAIYFAISAAVLTLKRQS